MGRTVFETADNWKGGVNTAVRPDRMLDLASFSRGHNTQLFAVGPESAVVATRPGCIMMNATKAPGGGTVLAQYNFRRYLNGFTPYHMVVLATGRLMVMNDSNGSLADADSTSLMPFTAGEYYPDAQVANNCIFIVNGHENVKFNGTNVQGVGITRPSAPTVVDSGVAGNPNGTYDFAITYYNSVTGQESSRSEYNSVTVASKKITVSWANSSDPQVDTVRVYVRKGTLSGSFFRCITGVTPAVNADGGYTSATTSTTVDITDTQINALLNLAPNTTENDPPPVLDRIRLHQGRLFGVDPTDPSTLLFGKLSTEGIESFDPSFAIPVAPKDGDRIMALESANEMLLILKERSIHVLVGTYPDWELRLLTNEVGTSSHLSVITVSNITYFWSNFGPVSLVVGQAPVLLGQGLIDNILDQDNINYDLLSTITVGFDEVNLRLLWSLPSITSTRNDFLLPYNINIGAFESSKWDVMDVASIGRVVDVNGKNQLYYGDYNGRIFRYSLSTYTDGVPSGTTSGNGTAFGSNTLTDSGAAFFTGGDGLAQLYVYLRDANGANLQRKRIGSNTATILTLDSGVTWDITPDATWEYVIAGPDFQFDFGWNDLGASFWKKRYEFLYIDIVPSASESTVFVDFFTNMNDTTIVKSLSFTPDTSGAVWDVDTWDDGLWGGGDAILHERIRVGAVGRSYLARVRCGQVESPIAITRMGMRGEILTDKN